jgi:hypothetical protein
MKRNLLLCGTLSSLVYVAMNAFIPLLFDGYRYSFHTVSELSAIGAPTRTLWVWSGFFYTLLFTAFGFGVLRSAGDNRRLRVVAALIFAYCAVNFYWPPMHQRGVEPSLTDTLHIVWTSITVILMMLMMGFAAAALETKFRWYTIATMVLLMAFGVVTSLDAPKIPDNLPTPLLGVWERILIVLFMLWVIVFSITLMRKERADREPSFV